VETQGGVEIVSNPKAPMEAPATVRLQEQWRIGGESEAEGEFFGVIGQITTDPEGNVYLLDTQLSEVKVFSSDGAYLRTIGREGEGPGEFRQAQDMFFLPDGNLGVLQLAPGRIVVLSPQGEPMGDYPLPSTQGGASATPGGELYAVETYQDYAISMWDAAGTKKRVIRRDYDRPQRNQAQKDEMYGIFDALLQNQLPQYTIKVSDTDPDITNIYPQDDGSLWVLNSRGTRARPDGAMGVFDVFDSQGRFVRQLTLMGEGQPMKDGYFFLGDRIFVVTGLLEANIASRGGHKGDDEAEADEAEPIEVISYTLGGAGAQAK
jgi:hypothetical protein